MFLDEELDSIFEETKSNIEERAKRIWKACEDRVETDKDSFFGTLRQTDSAFRVFAKRHEEINPDFFKNEALRILSKGDEKKRAYLCRKLKWK